jgi:hypothetical protein
MSNGSEIAGGVARGGAQWRGVTTSAAEQQVPQW